MAGLAQYTQDPVITERPKLSSATQASRNLRLDELYDAVNRLQQQIEQQSRKIRSLETQLVMVETVVRRRG